MPPMLKEKIVNSAGFWAILADETTDVAKREQLVICLRFESVADDKYAVFEEPVALMT